MSRKKVKVTQQPMDHDALGKIADLVWKISQSTSTPEEKAAAQALIKDMGGYFATPIRATTKKEK